MFRYNRANSNYNRGIENRDPFGFDNDPFFSDNMGFGGLAASHIFGGMNVTQNRQRIPPRNLDFDFDHYDSHESMYFTNEVPRRPQQQQPNRRPIRRGRSVNNMSNRNNANNRSNSTSGDSGGTGMFSISISNDQYNPYNSHRNAFGRTEDDFDDILEYEMNRPRFRPNNSRLLGGVFDSEDEIPLVFQGQRNGLSNAVRMVGFYLTNQARPEPPKKEKIKLRKVEMTKRLYQKNDKGKLEAPTCVICLGVLKLKENVVKLPCKHIFHFKCLDKWVEVKEECPYCRTKIEYKNTKKK